MICVLRCDSHFIEVLVQAIHKEKQQLLRVLLVVAGKLVVDLSDSDLEVAGANELVLAGPEGLHDDAKLLHHLTLVPQDVGSAPQRNTRFVNCSEVKWGVKDRGCTEEA